MLIFTDGAADYAHGFLLDGGAQRVLVQHNRFSRNHEGFHVDIKIDLAFEFNARALRAMQNLTRNDRDIPEPHLSRAFDGSRLGDLLLRRKAHREHHGAVREPFHLRAHPFCVWLCKVLYRVHPQVYVVLIVQLVDKDNLLRLFERTTADELRWILWICAILRNIVLAIMRGNGRHVVRLALDDCTRTDAAVDFSRNAVAVALREASAVDKHAAFHRSKIAAFVKHFFQKQHRTFDQFTGFFFQIAVFFELHHLHQPVEADQRLLGGVACFDVIDMPGDVAPFVRRDGRLYIRAGELAYHHVEHMGHRCLTRAGFDVFRVHLCAHAIARKEPPKRNRIR